VIFSELYSAYYNAVAAIIKKAVDHPIGKKELRKIIEKQAFGESILSIEPAFENERWQVLKTDGTTNIKHRPNMPLTLIQKRWLKAISMDPRVRLFADELPDYPDVEPLFTAEDYCIFDKYSDGDDYESETYRRNFRLIMDAIRKAYPVTITTLSRNGRGLKRIILPKSLEYSEKDDKFRVITSGKRTGGVYNLGRILSCERYEGEMREEPARIKRSRKSKVTFELYDQRNALERVLLHFAHFEKEAEKIEKDKYRITIRFNEDDKTEMVIRILSFGPMIRVTEPASFVKLIKERLIKQLDCEP